MKIVKEKWNRHLQVRIDHWINVIFVVTITDHKDK